MKMIGEFIGLCPDQGRLHPVDAFVKLFQADIVQLFGKITLQQRVIRFPEWQSTANAIFPKPALAFMNAEAAIFAKG
jgi:hypothetical protein